MSNAPFCFSYEFHPVGQGLFTSGSVRQDYRDEPLLQWVYDCGTSSSPGRTLIDDRIALMKRLAHDRYELDLVTVSHFDHDHISGICGLFGKHHVNTLMLPYMHLAERLLLAFEEGLSPDDELMGFFVNPVAYLASAAEGDLDHVLFVLPSAGEGPPMPPGSPLTPDREEGHSALDFRSDNPSDGEDAGMLDNCDGFPRVSWLAKGSAITWRGLWEFVPYNDDSAKCIPTGFVRSVREERGHLLQGKPDAERAGALARLKQLYLTQFGSGSEKRNVISLFLYAGPVYPSWRSVSLRQGASTWYALPWHSCSRPSAWYSSRFDGNASVLYSGDGYLDTEERLMRLVNYVRRERIGRVGVFQVMHHGSKRNWHKGVADRITPQFSIFSSDPHRKKWWHPHAAVLRDFWDYCPMQVDRNKSATVTGCLSRS